MHSHPCSHCQTPVDCNGGEEQNYDGWPDVICVTYHIDNHADVLCDDCLRDEDLRHDADMEQNEPEDVA